MRKILIVRPDGIGDFVIFSGVLEEYAKLYKDYKIDLLCHPCVKELMQSIPFINKKYYFDSNKTFRKKHLIYTVISIARALSLKYDKVIYPVYSRTKHDDLLIKFMRAKEKITFDGNSSNDPNNKRVKRNKYFTKIIESEKREKLEIERNVEFINKLGANVDATIVRPKIWFSDKDDIEFQQLRKSYHFEKNDYIIIFPGARYRIKYWENKKWIVLIKQLLDKNLKYKIVILGYGNDIFVINDILKILNDYYKRKIINLYKKTTLRILARTIQDAKLFIGTDSGTVHIAAAVETPNICLMGGGHFGRFYPYGDLGKNKIVYKKMDCYGCNWRCKYKYPKCLSQINVYDVLKQVEDLLRL